MFRQQLEGQLAQGLITFDLPGHGDSSDAPEPTRTYTRPGLADATLELLGRLAVREAIIVGWSLGGHIGMEMIPRFAGLRGLMIIGAPPVRTGQMASGFSRLPPEASKAELADTEIDTFLRAILGSSKDATLRDAVRRADGRFRRCLFESARAGSGIDQRLAVETSAVPLAVVNGSADPLVRLDYFENIAYANLWSGRCHRVEGAGHAPFWEVPERFDAVLESFLQDLKSDQPVFQDCDLETRLPGGLRAARGAL